MRVHTVATAEGAGAAPLARSASARGGRRLAASLALLCAAPFVGLAYVVAFPFAGTCALGKCGLQTIRP